MTNKDRTILACWKLAEKYRKPQGEKFFLPGSCPLCKIHDRFTCKGCPLATETGKSGCWQFKSNIKAQAFLSKFDSLLNLYPAKNKTSITFISRAEFFEKIIPILEKIPAKRFTKKGWTYFNELDRAW